MVGLVREAVGDRGLMTAVDAHRFLRGGGCNDIEPSERALAARVFPIDEPGITGGVLMTSKEDCPSCSSFSSMIYWSNPTPGATDGVKTVELGRRMEEAVMGAMAVAPFDWDCASDVTNRRTPFRLLLVLPPPESKLTPRCIG